MKGDAKVIEFLNQVLKAELTAINQYFLHAEMCENWGYERLAKLIRKESIEEMVHAEKLMERILYLDGTPNMTRLLQDQHWPDRRAAVQERSAAGVRRCQTPERWHPIVRGGERRRIARAGGEDPDRRRASHRLARGATARDRRDGLPELPGAAVEGRRVAGSSLLARARGAATCGHAIRYNEKALVLQEFCRPALPERRDGRVAEGARLESVCTRKGTQGSNPCLSAIASFQSHDLAVRLQHSPAIWA